MQEVWTYKYNSHTIEVHNAISGTDLVVDGKVQDRQTGISLQAQLTGKLPEGDEIKASIGGIITLKCNLFVNNELQTPVA